MLIKRYDLIAGLLLLGGLFASASCCRAQAALLMEEPYGFYGLVNPTGHNAFYFRNICAASPTRVRHCHAGELGAVISRYEGVDGYDWIAMPLIPYLYSVASPADVPSHVNHEEVQELRNHYREVYLAPQERDHPNSHLLRNGWTPLIGVSYDRRIFAFRFNTTPEQDDALIARLNDTPNVSHFDMLYNNCADFARGILDIYFPHAFHRSIFPDLGITTPKQVAYKLARYGHKHPSLDLAVFEIPQTPGYRRRSGSAKDVAESMSTTVYAIPITLVNPYLAGCIFADYLARGRFHLVPTHPRLVSARNISLLTGPQRTSPPNAAQKTADAVVQALGATPETRTEPAPEAQSGLTEAAITP